MILVKEGLQKSIVNFVMNCDTNGTMDSDSECTCCDGSIELL